MGHGLWVNEIWAKRGDPVAYRLVTRTGLCVGELIWRPWMKTELQSVSACIDILRYCELVHLYLTYVTVQLTSAAELPNRRWICLTARLSPHQHPAASEYTDCLSAYQRQLQTKIMSLKSNYVFTHRPLLSQIVTKFDIFWRRLSNTDLLITFQHYISYNSLSHAVKVTALNEYV